MKNVSGEEFDKAHKDGAKKNFVERSAQKKADSFNSEDDFVGTLFEFDLTFEWILSDDKKILKVKSTDELYTGLVHIKDSTLDELTYPNQEQKIKFDKGEIKFIDSREVWWKN